MRSLSGPTFAQTSWAAVPRRSPSFFIPDTVFLDLYILEEDLFKQGIGLYGFEIGNPFAEPRQIHSNIVNGYGVFSAYALTRTEVQ